MQVLTPSQAYNYEYRSFLYLLKLPSRRSSYETLPYPPLLRCSSLQVRLLILPLVAILHRHLCWANPSSCKVYCTPLCVSTNAKHCADSLLAPPTPTCGRLARLDLALDLRQTPAGLDEVYSSCPRTEFSRQCRHWHHMMGYLRRRKGNWQAAALATALKATIVITTTITTQSNLVHPRESR